MLRLPLLAALLAASASAQDAAVAPTPLQSAALVAAGAAGSVVLVAVTSPTAATPPGLVLTATALPVGAAGGVHLAGRALGLDGSFRSGLERAALGAGVALAGATALWWGSALVPGSDGPCDVFCTPQLVAAAGGVALIVVLPAAFAARGYAVPVQPAVLTAPEGERALGLSLRVGL